MRRAVDYYDLVAYVGLLLTGGGLAMISVPLAMIVVGAMMMVFAVLGAYLQAKARR